MIKENQVRKITRLAMLLALGVLLNYTEAVLLPTAFISPGVKLGLANTVGLIVLYLYDDKTYMFYGLMRVMMTSLFTGFGFNFLIAISGFLVASSAVLIVKHTKQMSIFGLSMVSAVFHGIGQIMMVSWLYQSIYMINYLPILVVTSLFAGLIIAKLSQQVLFRIEKVLI